VSHPFDRIKLLKNNELLHTAIQYTSLEGLIAQYEQIYKCIHGDATFEYIDS